jgi:hypothetical protein
MNLYRRSVTPDVEREALAFLRRARKLRGLSPAQLQRVEYRLIHSMRPNRRRLWVPALAALCLVLIAGTAVAHVVDLSRLPIIGALFPIHGPSRARKTLRVRSLPSPGPSFAAAPADVDVPTTPPAAIVKPSSVETFRKAQPIPPSGLVPAATSTAESGSKVARSLNFASPRGAGRHTEPSNRGAVDQDLAGSGTPGGGTKVRASANPVVEPEPVRAPTVDTAPHMPRGMGPTSPAGNPILAESRSLSAALAQWHRDHDAQAALAALDIHERRFPTGQMQLEAKLLRAEILLQQGREREGLALLDSMYLPDLPRGRELQTVRGELRIKHGRCTEGRRDLDHVLAKDRTDVLARRAAHAISLCP